MAEAGTGVLEAGVGGLEDPYTFTGGVWVQAGSLVAREDGPHPLGTGKIEISGGFLDLAPVGSGQDLSLSLAGGGGSTFTFSGGGGLVLDRGDHTSVELTLGGHTDGLSPNFIRSGRGTLMLIPASGMAGHGNSERIKVAGTGGNLPQPVNAILTPHVVAADPTRAYDGSFVAYDTTSGFLPHAGTDNAGVSLGAMDAAMVADVTVSESLSGANAVYALRIGEGVEVSGPGSLAVGSGAEGQAGGLILNGGRLTASGGLAFGEAEGVIYTGSRGGRIDAPITSAAGVIYFGPGQVEVSTANSYGGETLVQDGHLQVRNTSGSATGNGTVTLTRNRVLSGDGTISGNVQVDGIVAPGLFGPTGYTPAALTFEADADFRTDSIFSWTLVSLTDGPLGGVAGEDWSFLSVGGGISFSEDAYLELNFADIAGPESGDPFWSEERMWSFASYDTLNGLENLSVFGDDLEYGDFRIQPDLDNRLLNLEFIPGLGVIPEPSTFALLVTAMMLGAMVRHRAQAAGPDPTRHAAILRRYRVRT